MRKRFKKLFVLLLAVSVLSTTVTITTLAEEQVTDNSAIDKEADVDGEAADVTNDETADKEDGTEAGVEVPEAGLDETKAGETDKSIEDVQNQEEVPEAAAEAEVVTFGMDATIFDDIKSTDWYHPYVSWVLSKGIMTGKGDNKFAPAEALSRSQFATVLHRISGSPQVGFDGRFPDVPDGTFFSQAVSWAVQDGVNVITGYENGFFGAADSITREQLATMLYRFSNYKQLSTVKPGDLSKFPDASSVSKFAAEAMKWAVGAGIISGDQGMLNPQGHTNRAVCATIITRFCEKLMPGQLPDVPISASCGSIGTSAVDKELGTFWVKINNVQSTSEVSKIQVPIWCAADQSDIFWYTADKQSDGSYGFLADPAKHRYNTGTYNIHVYISMVNGIRLFAGSQTTNVSVNGILARVYSLRNNIYNQVGRDLYACYNWSVMTYYDQGNNVPSGYTPSQWYSIYGMENHRGDCQVMAATFYQLAKGLGYDAHYIQGYVPLASGGMGDHGWVEIIMNGTTYVFDPDFQAETGRNGYQITYGSSGTWRYSNYGRVD